MFIPNTSASSVYYTEPHSPEIRSQKNEKTYEVSKPIPPKNYVSDYFTAEKIRLTAEKIRRFKFSDATAKRIQDSFKIAYSLFKSPGSN